MQAISCGLIPVYLRIGESIVTGINRNAQGPFEAPLRLLGYELGISNGYLARVLNLNSLRDSLSVSMVDEDR